MAEKTAIMTHNEHIILTALDTEAQETLSQIREHTAEKRQIINSVLKYSFIFTPSLYKSVITLINTAKINNNNFENNLIVTTTEQGDYSTYCIIQN